MAQGSTGQGRGKRDSVKQAARRLECLKRWLAGESQRTIAKSIKVSPSTVHLDIQLALKEWRAENRGQIKEAVELEWEILNWATITAQRSFEASCDPKTAGKAGDARFIELMMKSGEHRRKLLGLDKPAKIEAQTTTEVNLGSTFKPIDQLRAEIRQHLDRLAARKQESSTPSD
jgi:hypothetical protein